MYLPSLYLITAPAPVDEFCVRLERALNAGVRLIQLRLPGYTEAQYTSLAKPVMALCRRADAGLLLNCSPTLAIRLGADGIHLSGAHLNTLTVRPLSRSHLVAASCHNWDELVKARNLGVNFAVLSPVLPTTSHPEAYPLGWEYFGQLVAAISIPIYALGGMLPAHLPLAHTHGARGIAVLGAIWETANIEGAINLCTLD